MDKMISIFSTIKDICSRIALVIISLFYMATNGISAYFCLYGLYNFIPKAIDNYNKSNDGKLIFYTVLSLIIIVLVTKFIKYFVMSVKTLFLAILPDRFL